MDFLESPRFPEKLGQYSSGGPCFLTEVVNLRSGMEQRNACWSRPLHRYDVSSGVQTQDDLRSLLSFFNQVRGRWLAFRFKDWLDFSSAESSGSVISTDQWVGVGDGMQRSFQLIKTTKRGELEHLRVIQKPVTGTVVVAVEGVEYQTVAVDHCTGVVTFTQPPPLGAVVTAGFEFDVPCRFDNDQLSVSLQHGDLGSYSLQLVEVRLSRVAWENERPVAPSEAILEGGLNSSDA